MKTIFRTTLCLFFAAAGLGAGANAAQAQQSPVVVELFTSQGCSSCPPADALLSRYVDRDDVLALAFHVDYWDYIGWADTFADPSFTRRQKLYAHAAQRNMVYTPQMIVGGADDIVGHDPSALETSLASRRNAPSPISITLSRNDRGVLRIDASPRTDSGGDLVVQVVEFVPHQSVSVRRGENAGRDLQYHNIVTSLKTLREWDGAARLSINTPTDRSKQVAVLIQKAGYGPIVAAARLR